MYADNILLLLASVSWTAMRTHIYKNWAFYSQKKNFENKMKQLQQLCLNRDMPIDEYFDRMYTLIIESGNTVNDLIPCRNDRFTFFNLLLVRLINNSPEEQRNIVERILGLGADINLEDGFGRAPIKLVMQFNNLRHLYLLFIEHGAILTLPIVDSCIFHIINGRCTERDLLWIHDMLQHSGLDLNSLINNDYTLLTRVMMHLTRLNSIQLQQSLLEKLFSVGVDINQPDKIGSYAIWYLFSDYRLNELIPFFIQHDADLSVRCQGVNIPEYLLHSKERNNRFKTNLDEILKSRGIQPTNLINLIIDTIQSNLEHSVLQQISFSLSINPTISSEDGWIRSIRHNYPYGIYLAIVASFKYSYNYERLSISQQDAIQKLEDVFRHNFTTVYGVCPVDPYEANGYYPFSGKVGLIGFVDESGFQKYYLSKLRYSHQHMTGVKDLTPVGGILRKREQQGKLLPMIRRKRPLINQQQERQLVNCLEKIMPLKKVYHLQRLLSYHHDLTLSEVINCLGITPVVNILLSDSSKEIEELCAQCKRVQLSSEEQPKNAIMTHVMMNLEKSLFQEFIDFL